MPEPWKSPSNGLLRSEDARAITQAFLSLSEKLKTMDDTIAAGTGVTSLAAGSGISVSAATGAVTIGNTGVTGLTAGAGIGVSGATGAITVTNNGVRTLTGTANQVNVSASTGTVTLSLPQDINTAANVTFGRVYANDWFRPAAGTGMYWEAYGGGFRMNDATWIRSYGDKSLWMENGAIGTNYAIMAGFSGNAYHKLGVDGNMRTTGRYYSNEWIQFDNYTGVYSPLNAAHMQPNPGTFGSWSMSGDRNGWRGIEFGQGTWGMTLMMGVTSLGVGNQINGVHANGYGWMWYNQWQAFYAGSYNGLSTIEIKQEVKDLEDDALNIVLQLREVDFQYKQGTVEAMSKNMGTWADRNIGFIAEEVNEICPEVVAMDPSGTKPTAISLMAMLPLLTKSIKQLNSRLEALENA